MLLGALTRRRAAARRAARRAGQPRHRRRRRCRREKVMRAGLSATKFRVHGEIDDGHRTTHARTRTAHDIASDSGRRARTHRAMPTARLAEIAALIDRSALSPAARRAPKRSFSASAKPRPRSIRCRSTRFTCTRSARSTPSSTSSARCSRSSGSRPIASSCSPLNVGGGMVQVGARRVSRARARDGEAAGGRPDLLVRAAARARHADRRAAASRPTHRPSARCPPCAWTASATAPATATPPTRRTCCGC